MRAEERDELEILVSCVLTFSKRTERLENTEVKRVGKGLDGDHAPCSSRVRGREEGDATPPWVDRRRSIDAVPV